VALSGAARILAVMAGEERTVTTHEAGQFSGDVKAFLARRISLQETGQGNVVVLGSRYSANTLAVREFLTRDGHPFTYLDLDSDRMAQELLLRFGVPRTRNSVNVSPRSLLEHLSHLCLVWNDWFRKR
jgi:thioredoxin reductase (NADPH)